MRVLGFVEQCHANAAFAAHDAHATTTAAARGLEDNGEADLLRLGDGVLRVGEDLAPRKEREAEAHRVRAGRHLVAPRAHRFGRGTDEREAAFRAQPRELGVLGEEAVARMNRVGRGDLGCADDRGDVQVAPVGRGGADAHRLIGEADVKRFGVGFGVDGDRGDAELAASAKNAKRDLAAVRDEDLLEHDSWAPWTAEAVQAFLTRKSFWPNSTDFPFCAKHSTMVPETSASISFINFIASTMQSV